MKADQKSMIENYIRAYNSFNVEGMVKDMDDGVIFENISGEKVGLTTTGVAAFKKQAEAAKAYFSERNQTITKWEFSDGQITIGITYTALVATDLQMV